MRVVAIHILLVLLAIYLRLKGVQADTSINTDFILHNNSPDDISSLELLKEPPRRLASGYGALGGFQAGNYNNDDIIRYNNGYKPERKAYSDFLGELRKRLASGKESHGIPILRPITKDLTPQIRFIRVELENNGGDVVTIVIDAHNAYVLGYITDNSDVLTFHYLDDCPKEALGFFNKSRYQQSKLGFSGNYVDLGNREKQYLGYGPLNDAIRNLYYTETQSSRTALLVIVQMVAEAARIGYIEYRVRVSFKGNSPFQPDPRMLTLENTWGSLSDQIQMSGVSGVFPKPVQIKDVNGSFISITNVTETTRYAALKLLKYYELTGTAAAT